jgi:phosphoribosylformylglycinamidine synthase
VIGMLGLIDSLVRRPPGVRLVDGHRLVVSGPVVEPNLAGSRFAADAGLPRLGTLPGLDLAAVAATADLVRSLVADGLVSGAHDVAEGGLGAAVAELAIGGGVGATLARVHSAAELFAESPGRVVLGVAPDDLAEVVRRHEEAGVGCVRLGLATGDRLVVKDLLDVALADLTASWRDALPSALGHGTTQG